jgi:two-component system, OmpR family, response regulator
MQAKSSSNPSGKSATVLLIEDDPALAEEMTAALRGNGYAVQMVDTIEEGLDAARLGEAAMLIMDRMLHGADGLTIVETLRGQGIKLPVLVVSGLSSVDERVRGLNAGGDDYLVKPFAMSELTARVDALLRRLEDVRTTRLRAGDLEMDLVEHRLKRGDKEIDLLPREFKLLEFFLRRPGQLVTRAMLLQQVWGYRFAGPASNVVDVHVGNLRRKIDIPDAPSVIVNIRGAGFMLKTDA